MSMQKAPIETDQLLTSYGEAWNGGVYSKIPELVSESFVLFDPTIPEDVGSGPEGEAHGAEGLEAFITWLRTGFPDLEVTTIELLAGEDVVMDEVLVTGTHRGWLGGIPPTGRRIEVPMMTRLRIEDAKIQEHRVYLDRKEFADQLGLTVPTVLGQLPNLAARKLRAMF